MKNSYKLYLKENNHNKNILFYVLCGYKKQLSSKVFNRLDKYFDIDADVCLVTSGKYDQEIFEMAKKRGWCYLATNKNNISIAQNATIASFPFAETIIKMDEDIFVTEGTFKSLLDNYVEAKKKFKKIAFVAPLLNVNGFGSTRLLMLTNCLEQAEAKFGKQSYTYGKEKTPAESNVDFVKYMWNINNKFMSIDEANKMCKHFGLDFDLCPVYFSIGLVLFERKFWNKIGYFTVWKDPDMGVDEALVNQYAKVFHYKKIICKNSVCGHFSFGPTNAEMMNTFNKYPDKF